MKSRSSGTWLVAVIAGLGCLAPLKAQPAGGCSDPKAHEFDFWIGEWEVYSGEDLAGYNHIQPILDGCVLQETWQGARGSAGSSFNFYDPQARKWRQLWVWRNGTTLELEGDYEDAKMTLEGESRNPDGKNLRNRITWFDNPDGTVRQLWETSADQGKGWQIAFDGLYRKKK
jgi:hypothetical protein